MVVTRLIKCPGGDLFLNATANGEGESVGKISIRVSNTIREPRNGFDHADCEPLSSDDIRHKVTWKGGKSMNEFEGKVIRLEVFLQDADLFTIVAK